MTKIVDLGAKEASAALPLLIKKIKEIADKKKKSKVFQEISKSVPVINLSGHPLASEATNKISEIIPGSIIMDVPVPNTTVDSLESDAAKLIEDIAQKGAAMNLLTGQYVVIPCGMSPLWSVILTMIHGISGHFPRILVLWRENAVFMPNKIIDLQNLRNLQRETRF